MAATALTDRKWLIQCKREEKIGPSKIIQYLASIDPDETKELHGVIFAASCNFSKRTIDAFYTKCHELALRNAQDG